MITIDVTQEDIDKALAVSLYGGNWGEECPLGQSLRRQGYTDYWVYTVFITINGERYNTPPEVHNFISNVDRYRKFRRGDYVGGENVKPIVPTTFYLDTKGIEPEK